MTTPHHSQPGSDPSADQAPSSSRSAAGAVVGGRYTLLDPLGAGGMGAVWRAHDDLLRRDVAVKEVLLPPGIPRDEQAALYERTLREARAAAGLSHPSVIRVYDVITDNGRPWIVMELLQARSVADMITQKGSLPPRAIAKIGLSVLGALETAHSAGVLHRDVKPANVLICSDGRTVLTDFGVARNIADNANLTSPGMVLGSPQYISPERAMGAEFGPPSDLFSLGVTLYTAAEGRPPFDRGDPLATMHAVVYEDPEPPRRAGPLTPVLLGLLAKEPTQRWDVERTRTELRAVLSGPLSGPGGPG
ncbi:MAG: serine/threonine-protein kinase, partial [Actinocatenispora sp.]